MGIASDLSSIRNKYMKHCVREVEPESTNNGFAQILWSVYASTINSFSLVFIA
jgi:hypothetical protein